MSEGYRISFEINIVFSDSYFCHPKDPSYDIRVYESNRIILKKYEYTQHTKF